MGNNKKRIQIGLKTDNKEILNSRAVKKWLKYCNDKANKIAKDEKWLEKITYAATIGLPIYMGRDGKMKVVEDLYGKSPAMNALKDMKIYDKFIKRGI